MDVVERTDPPNSAPELEMLLAWLEYHRATLLQKCAGLSTEQLCQRSCMPSTLTLIGLVRHMAEVEYWWFAAHYEGRPDKDGVYCTDTDPDGDFDNVTPETVDADFVIYERECEASRRIVQVMPDLEQLGVGTRSGGSMSLRWILIHMIEEYARHNGHADLLRERIDGVTGE
jgi:uncharacterized damage-inducible protein DinB